MRDAEDDSETNQEKVPAKDGNRSTHVGSEKLVEEVERERHAWARIARDARDQWAKENPY